jgi:hypothetical protein
MHLLTPISQLLLLDSLIQKYNNYLYYTIYEDLIAKLYN